MERGRLDRRIGAYTAAASAALAFGATQAEAAVVYTDIADVTLNHGDTFSIDFDGDTVNDITISGGSTYFNQISTGSVLGTSSINDNALALPAGFVVGPAPTTGSFGPGYDLWQKSDYGYYGNWINVSNRYLGVRFTIGGATHYGWVRMSTVNTDTVTIHDFAYESLADTPIVTGITAVPEPGTLALFASGAAGLIALRRRRRKAAPIA